MKQNELEHIEQLVSGYLDLLKNPKDKYTYVHTLNMIIWTVYFKKLTQITWGDLQKAAERYNWDKNSYAWDNGKAHKVTYWKIVMENFTAEKNRWE